MASDPCGARVVGRGVWRLLGVMRSSLRIGAFLAFALIAVLGVLLSASSCVTGELAECYHDLACPLTMRCIQGTCSCEDNRLKFCCSKFEPAANCMPTCRYEAECPAEPGATMPVSGATGGAGAGGVDDSSSSAAVGGAGGSSTVECAIDADCAQPADKRCGAGACVDGRCELVIAVGAIESQVYGDCQRLECDLEGKVVVLEDPGDYYGDGRECTVDFCQGATPVNEALNDGSVCPDSGQGVCSGGTCVECIDGMMGADDCKSPQLHCQNFWCVPTGLCPNGGGCGGFCAPCPTGLGCGSDEECLSNSCSNGGVCQLPTCDDGRKNNAETGMDCGGPTCPRCSTGAGCLKPSDCTSDVCRNGACEAPTCVDGKENGDETGIDCGGSCSPC